MFYTRKNNCCIMKQKKNVKKQNKAPYNKKMLEC